MPHRFLLWHRIGSTGCGESQRAAKVMASLSVMGTPVKVGVRCLFCCFSVVCPRPRPGLGRWGRGPGSRWSARSAARTNDLEAGADPPHTPGGRADEVKTLWFKSSRCLRVRTWRCRRRALGVPAPSLIWVHGQWSGDMMMDGVPDVRAGKGVRPLNLSGKSTQQRGGDRRPAGADRGHQLKYGQGTHTTHC